MRASSHHAAVPALACGLTPGVWILSGILVPCLLWCMWCAPPCTLWMCEMPLPSLFVCMHPSQCRTKVPGSEHLEREVLGAHGDIPVIWGNRSPGPSTSHNGIICWAQPGLAQGRCAREAGNPVRDAPEQPVQRQGLWQQQGGQPAQGGRPALAAWQSGGRGQVEQGSRCG